MSKPSPPPSPNYTQAATSQGAANVDAAKTASIMNNPNIVSPYGNQFVTWGNPSSGAITTGGSAANGGSTGSLSPQDVLFQYTNPSGQRQTQTLNLSPSQLHGQAPPELQSILGGGNTGVQAIINGTPYNMGNSVPGGGNLWTNPSGGSDQSLYNLVFGGQTAGAPSSSTPQFDANGQPILQPTVTQTLTPVGQQTVNQQQQAGLGLATLANNQTSKIAGLLNGPDYTINGQVQQMLADPGQLAPNPEAQAYADQVDAGSQYANPQTSINTSNVPGMPISPGMTAQNAIMSRLQPALAQQQTSLQTQLINQGLRPGDEAYDYAMKMFGQQQNDQLTQAALQGIGLDMGANQQAFGQAATQGQFANAAGAQGFSQAQQQQSAYNQAVQDAYQRTLTSGQQNNANVQQQFNQNLQAAQFGNAGQQQANQEIIQQRTQPINEIAALMSGSQVQNPQFQAYQGQAITPAPVFQGAQAQGQYNQQTYAQQVAARNALLGGLGSLGGSALGMFSFGR
jgi:hypothetical protein